MKVFLELQLLLTLNLIHWLTTVIIMILSRLRYRWSTLPKVALTRYGPSIKRYQRLFSVLNSVSIRLSLAMGQMCFLKRQEVFFCLAIVFLTKLYWRLKDKLMLLNSIRVLSGVQRYEGKWRRLVTSGSCQSLISIFAYLC